MAVILTKRRSDGGGSSSYIQLLIANEIADGTKNGINNIFKTLSDYLQGTLSVYYNGQRLVKDIDYKEQDLNEFKLIYVKPYNDDNLVVDYQTLT